MESSKTLLRMGHLRTTRRRRDLSGRLRVTLGNKTRPSNRHFLPVLLVPLPIVPDLRLLPLLRSATMDLLPMEMGLGLGIGLRA